jgi:hypothetical protein
MACKFARRRKLTQSMTNHVFGHEDWHEKLSIVDMEGEANELGTDHRSA